MERMPKKLPAMPHTKAAAWFKKRMSSSVEIPPALLKGVNHHGHCPGDQGKQPKPSPRDVPLKALHDSDSKKDS